MKTRKDLDRLLHAYSDATFDYGESEFNNGDKEYLECCRTLAELNAALDEIFADLEEAQRALRWHEGRMIAESGEPS